MRINNRFIASTLKEDLLDAHELNSDVRRRAKALANTVNSTTWGLSDR